MSGAVQSATRHAVAEPALRGLRRFASARGIPSGPEFLLDYDVIEAFCAAVHARHVPLGLVPAGRAGARRAGAAGDAVCGGEAAAPVLAG